MIDSVLIEQFKSIEKLRIDLNRLTVLVGPNAAGKSSILQAIELALRQATQPQLPITPMEYQPLRRKHSGVTWEQMRIEISGHEHRLLWKLRKAPEWSQAMGAGDSLVPTAEITESGRVTELNQTSSERIRHEIGVAAIFSLDPVICRQDQELQGKWMMGYRGEHLASMLGVLAGKNSARFQMLQEDLRDVVPYFKTLRIERGQWPDPSGVTKSWEAMVYDMTSAKELRTAQVSDGSILATAVLGAIHTISTIDDISPILLFDDIDNGLHPLAQGEIIRAIRRMLDRHSQLQVILTTHSPFVVDAVDPSSVRLVSLDKDGTTRCLPLTDHPEFNRWKDEFAPGELWNLFGEDWVSEPSRLEAEAQ